MTDRKELAKSIKKFATAYIFLHLNFNLGSVNLLPNWVGYHMMLQGIDEIKEEEPSAGLIRSLGKFLMIWELALWILAIFSASDLLAILALLPTVISLYFHFQLLTNVASIAARYGFLEEEKKILRLRTVKTLLSTLFAIPNLWGENAFTYFVIILQLIICAWIYVTLSSLSKRLEGMEEEMNL